MEKEILQALKGKFEGVSDQILVRVARKLAETVKATDDIAGAVDNVTFQAVLESYGDARATDATKTAVLNYEKKHGLKDGVKTDQKPAEPQPPADGGKEGIPEWAKALIESNKSLSAQVAAMNGEKLAAGRRRQLNDALGDLPAELRKGYERITLDSMDDDAFKSMLEEVKTEAEGIRQSVQAKGAVLGRPAAGPGNPGSTGREATDKEVEQVAERLGL